MTAGGRIWVKDSRWALLFVLSLLIGVLLLVGCEQEGEKEKRERCKADAEEMGLEFVALLDGGNPGGFNPSWVWKCMVRTANGGVVDIWQR